MPYLRLAAEFTAAAAAALRAQLGAGWDRPRTMFTLEPLRATGKLPCAGDLVGDLRLADRVWRVEQRLLLVDQQANATISLLLDEAPAARLVPAPEAERVQLTEDARAALVAEYAGREQPSECRLLMAALAASADLRAGDVVRDASFSRQMFCIDERLFLWTAANEVHVRYLVDVGMKAGDWEQLRQ